MYRERQLLKYVTRTKRGIEVGPYVNPLVPKRQGYDVITMDVFDAEQLRRKASSDPEIPEAVISRIEEVDLVTSAVNIAEAVGNRFPSRQFDYVLSSHNLEHLPDPIRFLQGCEQILAPGGVLSMAIPDHRFCFDYMRPVTVPSEWLEAYFEHRQRPTAAQVFRHRSMESRLSDGTMAWGRWPHLPIVPLENVKQAFDDWKAVRDSDSQEYRDAHCWTFTPESFQLLIADLTHLGLITLTSLEISRSIGCEFYAHLHKPAGTYPRKTKSQYYLEREKLFRAARASWAVPLSSKVRWPMWVGGSFKIARDLAVTLRDSRFLARLRGREKSA
ncbi:MAG: methyltransferase domain-containing protein [Hyphomicrobiaceae bacterium]